MRSPEVCWLESVISTQDEAHRLAALGAPHGSGVAARAQTGGRGTRGRGWSSGQGGLWISVIARPRTLAAVEVAGVRTGLALARLVDGLLGAGRRVRLKWPNDLILDEGKFGGILAEARWQGNALLWMTVGVGINLSNEIPPGLVPPARRLSDYGVAATAESLAAPVAAAVARATQDCPPLSDAELAEFAGREWKAGPVND